MKNSKMPINDGFTLIEALLALFIFSLTTLLISASLPVLKKSFEIRFLIEDEIGLRQIRRVLLLSDSVICDSQALYFYYLGEDASLEIDGDRVVKRNGYVIYLDDLENAHFSEKDHCIYLNYEKEAVSHSRLLVCS